MRKLLLYTFLFLLAVALGFGICSFLQKTEKNNMPLTIAVLKPRPMDRYSIENLSKAVIAPSEIKIGNIIKTDKDFTSYTFSLRFDPTLENKTLKKVAGLINIPAGDGPFPLTVLIRGYVDQKTYTTGMGTLRAGEYFAKNGYITVAPDFFGYGGSDPESSDIFESRFQTYTTVLTLLSSLKTMKGNSNFVVSDNSQLTNQLINYSSLFLWAHSNGGQITLTVLEITQALYPTVLWAPVSKPFPYSILYYTDVSDDGGKLIRSWLAKFEEDYNTDLYSLTKYLDRIQAPLQIHQGTADDAVPVSWTRTLCAKLKAQNLDQPLGEASTSCLYYQGSDHNLSPAWNTAIANSLEFFESH